MSGGVDSSVAAHLLLEQGYDLVGVFMRHGEQSPAACNTGGLPQLPVIASARADHKQGCCSAEDAADARRVASGLGIPFYALDLQEEFGRIMDYFVDEYVQGRTPNPCVVCNHWLKFGKLFEYADSIGAQYVATGHYARLLAPSANGTNKPHGDEPNADNWHTGHAPRLARGIDARKDQSYVLFGIDRSLLGRMLLPVGGYDKPWIRQKAGMLGLRVAEKKDSQEICFVTSGDHAEFVAARKGNCETSGHIVTLDGTVVGTHTGIERFTIGQRRGLGVALGERRFVVAIEPGTRRVVIGPRDALARSALRADKANWLIRPPTEPFRASVQIRYNSPAVPARVIPTGAETFEVAFDRPCFGVAPGQAAVCYDDSGCVLGGGWICEDRREAS